ncbi:uncharacterized protein UV8b_07558 [Ustilaginoidea virens]|uniref:Uncharacterized protein n=1 Tax=Ustilaginoidea virens TaxID=1159556 RepID=A0A8E5ML45_USTVR|nr:uncharacterized protein UV8b_07558 [Ustilaginoidea virens]QUC23317.1 hypothetical protein UV8b_07558 [Ustilaginoidea virens]
MTSDTTRAGSSDTGLTCSESVAGDGYIAAAGVIDDVSAGGAGAAGILTSNLPGRAGPSA